MYARYTKKRTEGGSSYQLVEQCSLFGCNAGLIPWLLARQISSSQGEPCKWHLPIESSLNGAEWDGIDYTGSTLIIDLKPKQDKTNVSLYEVLDVWGYSDAGWTPILFHLSGLFVDADPETTDRNNFTIDDADRDEPIYEFMYLDGSVETGRLVGRWNAPPASPTNAALLWPQSLAYFFECIRSRTPSALEGNPPNTPVRRSGRSSG